MLNSLSEPGGSGGRVQIEVGWRRFVSAPGSATLKPDASDGSGPGRCSRLRRRLPPRHSQPFQPSFPTRPAAAEPRVWGCIFPGEPAPSRRWWLPAQLSHTSCSPSLRRGENDPGTAKDDLGRSQRRDPQGAEGQVMNSWRRMGAGSAAHPQVRSHRVTPSPLTPPPPPPPPGAPAWEPLRGGRRALISAPEGWRDTNSDTKAVFVMRRRSTREGVIEQRGWDAGTVSAPGRSAFPRSWERAELQIPKIIEDGWHCKRSCCARAMPWKKGAAGGNGEGWRQLWE